MNWNKKLSLGALTCAAVLSLAACSSQNEAGQNVIAKGEGIEVTEDELVKELKASAGNAAVQQLVFGEIFENELGKDRVKEIEDEVDADTVKLVAQYGDEDKFKEVVAANGYSSVDEYKKALRYFKLLTETISKNINVSDDEVKKAYENYEAPRKVSHILVKDEDKAKDLIKQINEGGDFAKLAEENSEDKGSAKEGGSLGEVTKGMMVKEFEEPAFKLKAGEMTQEPVKSQYGWHIIKVDEVGNKGSFDEEKEKLEKQLRKEKMDDPKQVQQVLKDVLDKYQVKITDKDFKNALDTFQTSNDQEAAKKQAEAEEASEESK
ncbi:peptidylprolyl isomerase [Aerococcus sanguinicola]|uniref:Foldase protein PrsA n=1 Tax=Aerococcus sanguinicola TaxID=119206 RepID=A0A0X8FC07_9LACT|nr:MULTISPECIES: peptidylprolyl isomerase [Aerococcus]AMB94468.1 hypothetical protein AWM72_06760 [Aerococcus sanguinicola]MDK7049343.1 peptidylprolyl isomerase [Aerococcus sanguinicola]OFT95720.1 hypothetical protein HMPREF3090_03915 [Aerococcus sp. HMSC23C02]PKZ23538.1 peptidylprolyl isomerase [Aerococcus sanguinicola]